MPPSLRKRAAGYRAPSRRQDFVAGRLLLAEALRRLGQSSDLDKVQDQPGEKPRIPGGPFFSISHSRGVVACACSELSEVGLDVEAHRHVVPDDFRPWFSPEELESVWNSENPGDELIRRWCAKEALFKAAGPAADEFGRIPAAPAGPVSLAGREWHLYPLDVAEGYEAVVASSDAAAEVSLEYIPGECL